jgi:enolase-phosphatase E1
VSAIGFPANEILFLSDITAELDAARAAGLRTTRLCRPPETCAPDSGHPCVTDFDSIRF